MHASSFLVLITVVLVATASSFMGQGGPTSSGAADPDLMADLVAANHILAGLGYIDALGHISARHHSDPNRFLLASRAVLPAEVTAVDIVEYDLEGNPVNLGGRQQHRERFIHAALYRNRPDVNAVIHSHYPELVTDSGSALPLRPFYILAGFIGDRVPVFDAQDATGVVPMLTADSMSGRDLAQALGDRPAILMKGHGVVVVGPSIRHSVARLIYIALNGRLQAQAVGLGEEVRYLSPEQAQWSAEELDAPARAYDRQWEQWRIEAEAH